MKVTYFGTTVLLFDDGKNQILFDAHITRPSINKAFWGKLETDEKLADEIIENHHLNRLSAIFISHSHYDHVLDAPYFAKKCDALIYGSESALNVARGGNVKEEKLKQFHAPETICIGDYKITVLPSCHSKAHWYNDDLGKTIDSPVSQPARKKKFKEGGSFDFLVENDGKKYLIRPSFNYIKGQLDGIKADVLFLAIGGMADATKEVKEEFFKETVEKVNPEIVIPIHWDNFFIPFNRTTKDLSSVFVKSNEELHELAQYFEKCDRSLCVQLPLTSMHFPLVEK